MHLDNFVRAYWLAAVDARTTLRPLDAALAATVDVDGERRAMNVARGVSDFAPTGA